MKLLWDAIATEFGGRHELYEINYGGSTEEIRRYALFGAHGLGQCRQVQGLRRGVHGRIRPRRLDGARPHRPRLPQLPRHARRQVVAPPAAPAHPIRRARRRDLVARFLPLAFAYGEGPRPPSDSCQTVHRRSASPPTMLRMVPPPRSGEGWRPRSALRPTTRPASSICEDRTETSVESPTCAPVAAAHRGLHPAPERGGGTVRRTVGGDAGRQASDCDLPQLRGRLPWRLRGRYLPDRVKFHGPRNRHGEGGPREARWAGSLSTDLPWGSAHEYAYRKPSEATQEGFPTANPYISSEPTGATPA